jgi:hypothetical protein
VGIKDSILLQFDQAMDGAIDQDGSSIRVQDPDGTIADLICGPLEDPTTIIGCGLNKGEAVRLGDGRLVERDLLLWIVVVTNRFVPSDPTFGALPGIIAEGSIPGLQYPLQIISASPQFKDLDGQALNVAGSPDHIIEIVQDQHLGVNVANAPDPVELTAACVPSDGTAYQPTGAIPPGTVVRCHIGIFLGTARNGLTFTDIVSGGGRWPDTQTDLGEPRINQYNRQEYGAPVPTDLPAGWYRFTVDILAPFSLGCYRTLTQEFQLDQVGVAGHLATARANLSVNCNASPVASPTGG